MMKQQLLLRGQTPLVCSLCARTYGAFLLVLKNDVFLYEKSCGKSHFFLVEKSIVVYKTEGSEKYVCEKRRVDLGGPLECESNACKKKSEKKRWRGKHQVLIATSPTLNSQKAP